MGSGEWESGRLKTETFLPSLWEGQRAQVEAWDPGIHIHIEG